MRTEVISAADPAALTLAQQVLSDGGLVAFPTDTVYGLGADVLNRAAVSKLYAVKGRSEEKAIPVLAASKGDLAQVAQPLPAMVVRLAERFWPGPLTLVVRRMPDLPPELSPYDTVAVRVPDHDLALALLRTAGPLAVTSANRSGGPSSMSAEEVLATLGGRFDLLLDGGSTPGGTPSTVVDCTQGELRILRAGPISEEDVIAALD
jgi:tRNA threonylcarbamoyl adenosine modification protein (Sua5/YciO/YrdC/YwlC family)